MTGAMGLTGAQGIQGPKGDTGATGLAGPQGVPGPTGSTGAKGDIGAQGPQGVKGDTGATGLAGPTGPQGLPGATGPAGPQGDPGAKGATGSQGPQGVQGPVGPAGPVASGLPQLYLPWFDPKPAGANLVHKWNGKVTDTHNGWDQTNYRYVIPVSGVYLIVVKVGQISGSPLYVMPAVQTAPTPGGTYTTRLSASPIAGSAYGGQQIVGFLWLAAGSALRTIEPNSNAYNADDGPGVVFLQVIMLSQ